MVRRPPRSTLFPTRRSSDLESQLGHGNCKRGSTPGPTGIKLYQSSQDLLEIYFVLFRRHNRSEEHTSELQSHSDLVCRLLLEKKKKKAMFLNKMYDI